MGNSCLVEWNKNESTHLEQMHLEQTELSLVAGVRWAPYWNNSTHLIL